MVIGIVGLGLIGGSLAKAVKEKTAHKVLAFDLNLNILEKAISQGVVAEKLDSKNLPLCDIIILALYPDTVITYLEENAKYISKNAVCIDCAGTKTKICEFGFEKAKKLGFTFIGAHPMAGTEKSGYDNSFGSLYEGASFIMVPKENEDENKLKIIEDLALSLGFGSIIKTTAQTHDRIIAYTSQLAHITSSAFIKSPTASLYAGFSAGSFRDLTRVSYLNEKMWSKLFLDNKEYLLNEMDLFIGFLEEYKEALKNEDIQSLEKLLKEGKEKKLAVESEG